MIKNSYITRKEVFYIKDYFFNDNYKVLEIINDNQFQNENLTYCPLTQEEIARRIERSRITVYGILKELKSKGLITQNSYNKRYTMTPKAIQLVNNIKNIDWEEFNETKTNSEN